MAPKKKMIADEYTNIARVHHKDVIKPHHLRAYNTWLNHI
jgi:hypothetical protein